MTDPIVRRLRIDLKSGFSRHWFGGDAFLSAVFNATSMLFPQGEQFFIDSVRESLPLLRDDALRRQAQGFIGQEATHRHLHAQYNQVLADQGYRYVLRGWIGWRIRSSKGFSVRTHLAVTAAYEHCTAILALTTLRGDTGLGRAEPTPRLLWGWHSMEELEHRGVAFDCYRALGGGYLPRVAWFAYALMLFLGDVTVQTMHNLWRDGSLWRPGTWVSGLRFLLGRHGLAWAMLPHAAAYFRPGFHPWRMDDGGLGERWLAENAARYVGVTVAPAPALPPEAGTAALQ